MARERRQRSARYARRVSSVLAVFAILAGSSALAWNYARDNPGNSVAAAVLGTPGSFTATTSNSCTTIGLSWTAASNANSYLVEIRTANGTFSTVNASVGNVTTYTDSTNRNGTNRTYTYRLTPIVAGSSWTGTPVTYEIVCGIGEVDDLAATNGCTNTPVTLTWTAAGGTATMYDIWRSVNGAAAASAATNVAAVTWNDTTRTVGQYVTYYIVPNNSGGTNGQNSNTTPSLDVGFFIKSISITNGTTAGTIDNLDDVDVTFSKASNGTLPGGAAANQIYIVKTGGTRGLWMASSGGTAATTGIAGLIASANLTGTGVAGVHNGTAVWQSSNTVWHWERGSAAGQQFAAPTWSAANVTLGTSSPVRCSNGTTGITATNPTESGWF